MKEGINLVDGKLFYFTKPDINRPVEEQYVIEINDARKSFVHKEDAMLYLFDKGVKTFYRLTKELTEYANIKQLLIFEFHQIENRIGYVVRDYLPQLNEDNEVKNIRVYIWRFVGFGRSCIADSMEELMEMVPQTIHEYNNQPEERGYNSYPFYTRYYRNSGSLKQMSMELELS